MKIEKLKSGSYRIRKMYKGVTYTVVTDYKPTQKEAIQLLAAEMDKAVAKKERMTFGTAAREYTAVKENVISPSTVLLAIYGLRRSEICALTLEDIGKDSITVNKAKVADKNNKWVVKTTKTADSARTIYVPEDIAQKIRDAGKVYDGDPASISEYLARTQDKLGIPRFSLHKLRHYYASMSHSLGIPDQYIMQSGGWKCEKPSV